MPLTISKTRKKNYYIFHLNGKIDTQACFKLKEALFDTLNSKEFKICLELTEVSAIEASGIRFIENIQKILIKSDRQLETFGAQENIRQILDTLQLTSPIKSYSDHYEFEATFNLDMIETRKKYFKLGTGSGPIRHLSLVCPLCDMEGIIGYLCDEEQHELHWEETEITPQWHLTQNQENEIDFELYEVAVCHKCYFASNRLDNFLVSLPEGTIPSILDKEQKDRLVKKSSLRTNLIAEHQKPNISSFLSMPRESSAGYLAWQLYDRTIRDLSKDKAGTNTLEVARANILSAKFSENETDRTKSLTTAHVWLADIVNNPSTHTTQDLIFGTVYLISVSLALNKIKEAKKTFELFMEQYENDSHFPLWIERAKFLIKD